MSVGRFEREEVQFQYPENWTVQEQTAELRQLAVTVESPTGGFWSLQCLGSDIRPQQAADQALETMRAEYEQLEGEAVEEECGGHVLLGYDIDFYWLDLVVQSRVRSFETNGKTYLLLCQAEDRDFVELRPVFAAITLSLTRDLRN